jgi:hypothetical protein
MRLSDELRAWLALCLLEGYGRESIIARLLALGHDEAIVRWEVDATVQTPVFRAATAVARRKQKLASLLATLGAQLRQSEVVEGIPSETACDPADFFRRYYFANRPVVLRGYVSRWPALGSWSPQFFRDHFGELIVQVTGEGDRDPRYEDRLERYFRDVPFSDFLDRVVAGAGNDWYLVAKNRLLERSELRSALDDLTPLPDVLRTGDGNDPNPRLWLGSAGTITPLHHDSTNILFCQVYGRKLVRLIPPYEIENVYNDNGPFSAVDLDHVDFDAFPSMRRVAVVEATVEPGDALLLPIGWWHWVRALDVSISVSFQNFAVPGQPVVWNHAGRVADGTY